MPNNEGTVTIEDGTFLYSTNFRGAKTEYNERGDRVFNLVLPDDLAQQMIADGWNVKMSKPRREATPEEIQDFVSVPFIEVKVQFGNVRYPVRVQMRGNISGKITELSEDTIEILDEMEIDTFDIMIRPREYDINGKAGVKAYLKTLYVKIVENELDIKWAQEGV